MWSILDIEISVLIKKSQVSFLELMTQGLRNNWEIGHKRQGNGGTWQLFWGAPIRGDRRSIPIKADREIFSLTCADRGFP